MTPTTPLPPTIDFAQVRSRCPRAFAALMSFVRHRADLPPITPAIVYTWLGKHPRDLYDFFDEQGLFVGIHFAQANGGFGRNPKWYFYATILHGDSEDLKAYPTRAAAEAAAFMAGFEKLEEMLTKKEG